MDDAYLRVARRCGTRVVGPSAFRLRMMSHARYCAMCRAAGTSTWSHCAESRSHWADRRMRLALGDQAGIAAAGDINPQPTQRHGQPIAHADQEINVRESPNPPRKPAAQLDPAEIDDGSAFADGGQISRMLVAEGPRARVAPEPQADAAGNMRALLLGRRSDSRHGLAMPGADGCGVADHENFRVARGGEVRFHARAAGVVGGQACP